MLILIITADTNDADYVTSEGIITEEQLQELLPVFDAIKHFKPYTREGWTHGHNWPNGECCREDLGELCPEELYADSLTPEQIEMFSEMLPYSEYGIHTIKSIKVLEVVKETKYI